MLLAPKQEAVAWTAEKAVPAGLTASRIAVAYIDGVSTPMLAIRFGLERTRLTLCDDLHVILLLQPKAAVSKLADSLPGCRNPRRVQRTPVPAEQDLCRDALQKRCFHSDKPNVSACIPGSSLGENGALRYTRRDRSFLRPITIYAGRDFTVLQVAFKPIKGSVERSRHEQHFCSLLPYFLLS